MKCDVCGQAVETPFYLTEVDETGNKTSRFVCAQHATESGFPPYNSARLFLPALRSLVSFIRDRRRMPSENERAQLGWAGTISDAEYGTKEFDDQLVYFDKLVDFIVSNDRFPTDEELEDPF